MTSKNIVAVIQARMGSSRLPGKVMAEILEKPLIWYMFERLSSISSVSQVVISTTKEKEDLSILEFADLENIPVYAGKVNDILDRIYQTGQKFQSDIIVKINADCPLIDPTLVEKGIQTYLESSEEPDFVTNSLKETYPEGMQFGIFNFKTIEELWKSIQEPFWREYFVMHMIENKDRFNVIGLENEKNLSSLRWAVDYKEDLEFVKEVYSKLYHKNSLFNMENVLEALENNPNLSKINAMYSSKIGINDFYKNKENHVK